jgi:hypothetical protein
MRGKCKQILVGKPEEEGVGVDENNIKTNL